MKYFLSIIALIAFGVQTNAQCKVLKQEISESYEGDCKKGKAHGQGVAKGTDSYEGEFSKGQPNGQGTYTFANGDVYIGQFKKGKKHGEGTMTKADKLTVKGYWDNDAYIGTEKTPYKIIRKSRFVGNVNFSRKEGADQIIVTVQIGGRIQNANLNITPLEGSHGVVMNNSQRTTIQSVIFPYRAKVSFNLNGENHDVEFRISHGGTWNLKIPVNP
ncbi:MORN repeat-containing protein [Sediminicola luteus]|uniref:Uncharacterized protein n=1 Tax=Sediminicola luteus TaxID=319238 RepID=A0A2A4G5C2_9FLAO|nr:hypothetical protein [Sediminicola luteus]PCE63633.1 hypothetical protein B7P33_10130 [Sediminicola luteus]